MSIEIERKFLVINDDFKLQAMSARYIQQGYIHSDPERTVRVRINGDDAFLTIKGKSNVAGTARFEWEQAISVADAKELMLLCESGIIEKIRYEIQSGSFVFEVDEFLGDNQGLIIAEIELAREDDQFEMPEWLGMEVTGNQAYYNAMLSKHPYRMW